MISILTIPTGEVWPVGKTTHKQHPHHTRIGGVGVWCGGISSQIAGGEKAGTNGHPLLQIQAGCRPADEGAS
jgi:hypothetical protein